ncbi:energy transducer TonB [Prevotella sp. HMSC073D09]|uniref:energy transducer TonB n=1 Tax=Prevotella sp. HMSC073D09 TaxID=1739459 RepID=UPI001FED8E0E|nr:energy transducer TonB [Prevotella sp. HMSC073D09]
MKNKQTPKLFAGFKCLLFVVSALILLVIVIAPVRANAQDKKGKTTQMRKDTATDDKIYEVCEQMPIFEGGDAALLKYLGENLKYPDKTKDRGVQGRLVIGFIVEKDGSLTDVKVLRPVDIDLDAEVLRVIKGMPKWIPGRQNGKRVRVRYLLPIHICLQ